MNNFTGKALPIQGCRGCESTAGVWGCPIHSPNVYVRDTYQKPSIIKCPHCGKDVEFFITFKT